jgi:hypothetical protein
MIPGSLSSRVTRANTNLGVTTGVAAETTSTDSGFYLITVDGPGIAVGQYAKDAACVHMTDQTSFFLNLKSGVDQTLDVSVPVGSDRTVRLFYVLPSIPVQPPQNGQAAVEFLMQSAMRGEEINPSAVLLMAKATLGNLSGDQDVDLYLSSKPEWVDCADGGLTPPPAISNSDLRLSYYSPWEGLDLSLKPRILRYWRNDVNDPTIHLTFRGLLQNRTVDTLVFPSPSPGVIANPSPSPSGIYIYPFSFYLNDSSSALSLDPGKYGRFQQLLKLTVPPSGGANTALSFEHVLNYTLS